MDKILGLDSLEGYEIVNKEEKLCDTCELENTNCVKLLFANGGYVCAKKTEV